jgi:DNA repair ATPase RecN
MPSFAQSAGWSKCRMVLTYDGYSEILEEKESKQSEINVLTEKYQKDMKELKQNTDEKLDRILALMQENPKLANAKKEILSKI